MNREDYCVQTVGLPERHGCPADELPVPPYLRRVIQFEFGRADLSADAIAYIKELAIFMRAHPEVHVHLSGHADTIGDEKYNQTLSKQRVWSVYAHLTRRLGVDNTRVSHFAHSERYPTRHLDQSQFQALSRRVTVTFIQILERAEPNP